MARYSSDIIKNTKPPQIVIGVAERIFGRGAGKNFKHLKRKDGSYRVAIGDGDFAMTLNGYGGPASKVVNLLNSNLKRVGYEWIMEDSMNLRLEPIGTYRI